MPMCHVYALYHCNRASHFMKYVAYTHSGRVFIKEKATQADTWLSDMQGNLLEFTLDLAGQSRAPLLLRVAKFDFHHGSCAVWVCMVDIYNMAGLTVRQGKASLWVQTRLHAWQRKCAEHGLHETAVRLSSTGSDTADGAGSSPRVLPWIGASSMALVLLLGTMACSMPHLGGLKPPENGKVRQILHDLVNLAAITTIGLRLDCDVEGLFSCMPTFAVFSRGLLVALEVKDGHLDLSPLWQAIPGSGCSNRVKTSLSKVMQRLLINGNGPTKAPTSMNGEHIPHTYAVHAVFNTCVLIIQPSTWLSRCNAALYMGVHAYAHMEIGRAHV